MIEQEQVIRCDVTSTYISRERKRHHARCEATFSARTGLERTWPNAARRGWTQDECADIDGQVRHRCPHHSREHDAGTAQLWWDLRARARTARENGT